jgi:hypothetical protein
MKPASPKPAPRHHRCFYHSATGRQCRSWVIDPRGMFCPRHCAAQPNGPDDLTFHLLQRSCNFQNAEGIRDSLSRLYSLLACGCHLAPPRCRPRQLTRLLLRTLPALYNDPYPQAGVPFSVAQLAEREKARSLVVPPSQSTGPQPPAPVLTENRTPVLTQKPKPSQKPVLAENPILPQQVFPQPATQPTPHPQTDPAPSTTAPSIPATAATPNKIHKGSSPLPATRAEFAAQILKSLAPTPSIPTALNSTKPNPTATHQTQEQLSHLSSAHRPRRKRHHKRSAQRAPKPTHKQKKLPGKVAYQYARNRIPTPMGLDHRSITLPFTSTQSRDFLRR